VLQQVHGGLTGNERTLIVLETRPRQFERLLPSFMAVQIDPVSEGRLLRITRLVGS
jgi:hypothetical protein